MDQLPIPEHYPTMNPGSLVKPKWGDIPLFQDIPLDNWRNVGYLTLREIGIVIDAGFSPSDVYYYKLLVGEITGWTRAEHCQTLKINKSHETR
jgi:hypothetical protein